jgi:GrpB-like predicted nucleotidyltransferase (UPF0157 family)
MSGRFADQWGRVAAVLGPWLAGPVEHIGSTSIPGLAAKPVVDMLGPVRSLEVAGELVGALGTPVVAIARLVAAHVDTVRDVIHAFNDKGLAALDSQWAGDRPRLMSRDDEDYVAATATTRPERGGRSPTGACASSWTTWPTTRSGR